MNKTRQIRRNCGLLDGRLSWQTGIKTRPVCIWIAKLIFKVVKHVFDQNMKPNAIGDRLLLPAELGTVACLPCIALSLVASSSEWWKRKVEREKDLNYASDFILRLAASDDGRWQEAILWTDLELCWNLKLRTATWTRRFCVRHLLHLGHSPMRWEGGESE